MPFLGIVLRESEIAKHIHIGFIIMMFLDNVFS